FTAIASQLILKPFPTRRSSDLIGHRGIASKNNSASLAFDQVAVVSTISVALHSCAPMFYAESDDVGFARRSQDRDPFVPAELGQDRKSTRLNSSHQIISYAVFC